MAPLITREEALALGELSEHAEIEALVERVALGRVGDRQTYDAVDRPVDQELAAGELARGGVGEHSGGRLVGPFGPLGCPPVSAPTPAPAACPPR